jgi:uncharacterized SAM-binding protein YcdF (DUF218 family)
MVRRDKETKQAKKKAMRRGWLKFFGLLFMVASGILISGFVIFAEKVDGSITPKTVPKADGIVVWTGPGGGRLEAAAKLLKQGKGERLLISGVNVDLKSETVLNLLDLDAAMRDCCVDLDYAAEDTIGNARETAIWAEALGYDHILLVTSSYHMPRAEIEIAVASGRMRITPYPVPRSHDETWYSDGARFKRLCNEYAKLILAMLRGTETRNRNSVPDVPLPKPEE